MVVVSLGVGGKMDWCIGLVFFSVLVIVGQVRGVDNQGFSHTLVGLDCCGPFRTGLEGIVGLGLTWPSGTRTSRQPKIQAARSKIHPTS